MCRLVIKAILNVTKGNIMGAAGPLQLCAGRPAGIEAAIHAVQKWFKDDATKCILLVDATNAFNTLNCQSALRNFRRLCPTMASVLINCYREPAPLFIDCTTLLSEAGTTQSDPLAMSFYALATIPLIKSLAGIQGTKQVWYADDSTATGSLIGLRNWWDSITIKAPLFGYFANSQKSWLITKPSRQAEAAHIFEGTGVNIATSGRPHLGIPLGTQSYVEEYIRQKVNHWCYTLTLLFQIAITRSHAAYATYTNGLFSSWTLLCRTMAQTH